QQRQQLIQQVQDRQVQQAKDQQGPSQSAILEEFIQQLAQLETRQRQERQRLIQQVQDRQVQQANNRLAQQAKTVSSKTASSIEYLIQLRRR
ncbi:hypothetical protein ACJMK2_024672, partial [Sinanodonta woodiana]